MAEAKQPRRIGLPDEVGFQKLVEHGQRLPFGSFGDGCDHFRLERLAGDGRGVEDQASLGRQGCDLVPDGGRDRGRHRPSVVPITGHGDADSSSAGHTCELLEVERIAATLAVQGGASCRVELGVGE